MKKYLWLCVLCLGGCQVAEPPRSPTIKPKNDASSVLSPLQHKNTLPQDYLQWLAQADHRQQVSDYQRFLQGHHLDRLVPEYEFLRTARDWQKCGVEPYAVPPRELWPNILPTLNILKALVDQGVIEDFEVTSVYRAWSLNRCAGGADSSKHIFNAAMDFRLGPVEPDAAQLEQILYRKNKLCEFWRQQGMALNMGLGIYASGQIHIDSQGYRTWGVDHRLGTAFCQPAPSAAA